MVAPTKSRIVAMRVTPTDAELLRECAESEGLSLSDWLRRVALRRARRAVVRRWERKLADSEADPRAA